MYLILTLGTLLGSQALLSQESADSARPVPVKDILKQTILPEINLEDAPIEEALDPITKALKDHEVGIRYLGPDTLLELDATSQKGEEVQSVTLHLEEVPVSEALRYVTELARCQFLVRSREVLVFPGFRDLGSYRLAVFPLHFYQRDHLEEMGATLFEGGFNGLTDVSLEDLFSSPPAELGLKTSNPFKDAGLDASPGSLAALVTSKYSSDYLVVYGDELTVGAIEAYIESYLFCFVEDHLKEEVKRLEAFQGWDRVEELLKMTHFYPSEYGWADELHSLALLAEAIDRLENNPGSLEIDSDEIPVRIEAIRKEMLRLSNSYIETLRDVQRIDDLIPNTKPSLGVESDDPFAGQDLGFEAKGDNTDDQ